MLQDRLSQDLYSEICRIPLVDAHSHIDPHKPTARSLDEILGYHYYTELAHSAGMDKAGLLSKADPRERARDILYHMNSFDNTAQYVWFVEIARAFLDYQGRRLTLADCTTLWDTAEEFMNNPGWEERVLSQSNIEKVFLTNDFDDPLEGFDTKRYVPCLRTDELVFHLEKPEVRQRVATAIGQDVGDISGLRQAITAIFEYFEEHGAKACAVSLPPDFCPEPVQESALSGSLSRAARSEAGDDTGQDARIRSQGVFWLLAEHCRQFKIPFCLMIGVNRNVYRHGVYQGQDLFDQRTSLIQFATLFNAFPEVTFCVSVLTSCQNQELVSYSWIFPNVITFGHWWYSNIPAYIEVDIRARLQAVPKTKQIGYYSDMYKLEFGLPKFNMYRRILAQSLADNFIRTRIYSESQAMEFARLLLRDNARRIFNI